MKLLKGFWAWIKELFSINEDSASIFVVVAVAISALWLWKTYKYGEVSTTLQTSFQWIWEQLLYVLGISKGGTVVGNGISAIASKINNKKVDC